MVGRWLSMAEAAARLEISTRTLRRRIARGELQAREGEDGRREILLDTTPTALDTLQDTVSGLQGAAGAAVTAYRQAADEWRDMLSGSRRSARAAWAVVALLLAAAGAGGMYAADRLGRADMAADNLRDTLSAQADQLAEARARADRTAAELVAAREAAVRAETRLELAEAQNVGGNVGRPGPLAMIAKALGQAAAP